MNSDLLIFHHSELPIQVPSHKTSSQIWVFASCESVFLSNKQHQQSTWIDKFDWTTSYRRDSEGYGPYDIKSRQYNDPNKMGMQLFTKHTDTTKDRVTRIPLKTRDELRCSGRVSTSCSTGDTRRGNLVANGVINISYKIIVIILLAFNINAQS